MDKIILSLYAVHMEYVGSNDHIKKGLQAKCHPFTNRNLEADSVGNTILVTGNSFNSNDKISNHRHVIGSSIPGFLVIKKFKVVKRHQENSL